jgi:hypothetical protein
MKIEELKELLTQQATGFEVTHITIEETDGKETKKITKRQFIPGDLKALQFLLQLEKPTAQSAEHARIDGLTLDQTIAELRESVQKSQQTIKEYEKKRAESAVQQLSFFDQGS